MIAGVTPEFPKLGTGTNGAKLRVVCEKKGCQKTGGHRDPPLH